jgi:beta-phosphoglucomutase
MLRAVVFDFDGVIANSEPLHFRAFRDVLAAQHVTLAEADYYRVYLGFDDLHAFRQISIDRGLAWGPDHLAELVSIKAVRMEQLEADTSILFPGAREAIQRAAAAVPLAIASGALRHEIRRVLDREQLTSCFQCIVGAEDTPASKPAPDPYLLAVARLGETIDRLQRPECVAIEDSPWGLQSAQAAGLRTMAVAHTYEASALVADLVVRSIGELDMGALEQLCAD